MTKARRRSNYRTAHFIKRCFFINAIIRVKRSDVLSDQNMVRIMPRTGTDTITSHNTAPEFFCYLEPDHVNSDATNFVMLLTVFRCD